MTTVYRQESKDSIIEDANDAPDAEAARKKMDQDMRNMSVERRQKNPRPHGAPRYGSLVQQVGAEEAAAGKPVSVQPQLAAEEALEPDAERARVAMDREMRQAAMATPRRDLRRRRSK